MRSSPASVLAIALTSLACTASEPGPGAPSPGSAGDDPTAARETGCAPGATRNAEGGYCLAAPPGEGAATATTTGDGARAYAYGGGPSSLVVIVHPAASITDETWAAAKQRLPGRVKSADGSASSVWAEADGRRGSATLLRGADRLVECRAISSDARVLQACQTIALL